MDASGQYRHLVQLGREDFLASAAPAALVRYRKETAAAGSGSRTLTLDDDIGDETLPFGRDLPDEIDHGRAPLQLYPLAKKPGASFPDRITIGRTPNNDVVINDTSISRLHAYLRRTDAGWVVADAGSKNGSWLKGATLEPRREQPIESRAVLRLGDVDATFYLADDLFAALGGTQ